MKAVRAIVAAVLAFVVLAVPAVVLADGRVALVVDNSTYAHIGRLRNAENDARDMSAALRRLGCEVTTEFDASRVALSEALRRFTRRSLRADVALVFYAGHGLARLERDGAVRFETVTLSDMLAWTLGASLRLVTLDACRNNPLARSMHRTLGGRSMSGGSFADLNENLLGDETLVAYAAAAGTAADGRGRNGPYTSALLAHLEQPLELGLLFRRVRAQVRASTNGQQRPHGYQSLVPEHYLGGRAPALASVAVETVEPAAVVGAVVADAVVPEVADIPTVPPATVEAVLELGRGARRLVQRELAAAGFVPPLTAVIGVGVSPSSAGVPPEVSTSSTAEAAPPAVSAAQQQPPAPSAEMELVFWQSIADSTNPVEFEAYLAQFPNGVFRALAEARLAALRAPSPGDTFRDCEECPEMVVLPSGGLAMSRYEVTRGEYRASIYATVPPDEDGWIRLHDASWLTLSPQTDRHPVVYVNDDDVQAYVSWLSQRTGAEYRLPTDAEWERATPGSPDHGGCRRRSRDEATCPVGSYGTNAAGLSDLFGNVSEWTSDCWEGDCRERVVRGGSWRTEDHELGRRFSRNRISRLNNVGFRVVKALD